jgi:hypothetical protein
MLKACLSQFLFPEATCPPCNRKLHDITKGKGKKKTQSEETEQISEPDSKTTEMLEYPDGEFMIKLGSVPFLLEKVDFRSKGWSSNKEPLGKA